MKQIMEKFFRRVHGTGLILYILITVLVISLYGGKYGFLEKLSSNAQDAMFKLRGGTDNPPADIIIVGIDDRSIDQIGRWPWRRDVLAQLVSDISQGSPRIIGLDAFLPEEMEEDTSGRTQYLAQEIYSAGNVILPIYFNLSEVGIAPARTPEPIVKSSIGGGKGYSKIGASCISAKQIYYPSPALTNSAFAFGHINIDYDPDGLIRREPLLIEYDGYLYPSFGLQLAAKYLKTERSRIIPLRDGGFHIGSLVIPIDKRQRMLVNYLGPNLSFKRISAMEILNGEVDAKTFSQKMVLVGLTATESKTWASIPSFGEINEVERIATVTENIIRHNFLKPLSGFWNLLVLILIGVFCALVLPNVSLTYRIVILMVFLFVVFNLTYILFSSFGILTQPIYPIAELLFFLIAAPTIKPKEKLKEKEGEAFPIPQAEEVEDYTQKSLSEFGYPKEEVLRRRSIKKQYSEEPEGFERPAVKEAKSSEEIRPPSEDTAYFSPLTTSEIRSDTPSPAGPPPLTQFGRYKIIELVGKGGMGTVYKGLDPMLDRPVALKTMRLDFALSASEISELKERLIQEAKAAGKLSHPNIVTIYDVGEEGGVHYIAMEYLSGYTLDEFIQKKGELNYRIVAKIILQICEALSYAHQHGIVHRDIKPANIMLLEDFHVKVMDFGIARLETTSLTKSNVAMGTPYYISPEQIEGKPADKRSDIFSLGVVIYELLTKQKPFLGENISSLMFRILNHQPSPPSSLNDKTPLIFDRIVAKAMAKKPEDRYQDADEITKILREFISSFVVTRSIRI